MFDFSEVEESKSFVAMQPGVNIPAKLEKVEINDGRLEVTFKGTGDDTGSFKQQYWPNEFDEGPVKEGKEGRFKHVIAALVPKDQMAGLKGNTIEKLYENAARLLSQNIGAECKLKIVYKYNNDTYCEFPIFTDVISSDLRPASLYLRTALDNNRVPRDRVKPMSEYGAVPDSGAPSNDGLSEESGLEDITDETPFDL